MAEFKIRAYPRDLASFARDSWPRKNDLECVSSPDLTMLEHLISVCYQASLLREEERPVRFRVIFLAPDCFPPDLGPPTGLHGLLFRDKLPFTERELRKVSPSVDFYGSLIGLWHDGNDGLSIWGIVHSGMRWTQSLYGGGKEFKPLPDSLVINVTNPGRVTVCNGSIEIATLNSGEIVSPSTAVFDSMWVRSAFISIADEELALHREARKKTKKSWAIIDPEFLDTIKKQTFMRIIGRVRSNRHGGTFIFIPDEFKEKFLSENPYIKIKYKFIDEEPARRFRTLIVRMANELAEYYGSPESLEKEVGWAQYLTSKNQTLSSLDESVFEWAHLVAGMTQVDGAVVMTLRLELVGFGAQISGKLDRIDEVAQALDPEGSEIRKEQTNCVGTRHHSAYSLCNSLHGVMAVVLSQDGTAQLVKWNDGMVTVWEQLSPSLIEV
ncbi:MAG: putative sensor domain DACNV-containing protein [Syntrophobacteraceae bacterium]